LAANSFVVDVAAGSTLDLSNATDLPVGALPAGSILQVVSTTMTDTFSTASSSYTTVTGLSASITPSSTSSKILVLLGVSFHSSENASAANQISVFKDGSNLLAPSSPGSRTPALMATNDYPLTGRGFTFSNLGATLFDSPNTSSSLTYDVRVKGNSGTIFVNRNSNDTDASGSSRGVSTITLMEVAG